MRLPITELLITDGMIDAHEAEWERWSVRLNKVPRMTTYEVIRGPAADEPISEETLKIIEDHPGEMCIRDSSTRTCRKKSGPYHGAIWAATRISESAPLR